MSQQRWIKIGWSQINITPDRPVFNHGQMYQRVSQYVHDPIMATALVLENGNEQAILLSADMTGVRGNILEKLKKNLATTEGLDADKLSFSVTHTHNSSNFGDTRLIQLSSEDNDIMPEIDVPDDILHGDEAEDFLADKLSEVVNKAWETRKPGGISYAQDYAAVAFNRRPVFEENGQKRSVMYGVCDDPSVVARFFLSFSRMFPRTPVMSADSSIACSFPFSSTSAVAIIGSCTYCETL
jgi:hypothetical protein